MSRLLPPGVQTLGDMFNFAGDQYPAGEVRTLFAEESLTFGQLACNGRSVARNLITAGVEPGTSVAVLIASGVELLQAICGIATAGAVLIPLPVPILFGPAYLARLSLVIENSGVRYVVVDDLFADRLASILPDIKAMTLSSLVRGDDVGALPPVAADDLAVVQYTSGSTSDPHGVALTHRNVLAGIRALHYGTGVNGDDVLCHWLPLSHDMGLFSTLASVGAGIAIRISSPQEFIKHTADWLRKFCEVGATILVGPNFSYRFLLDSIPKEDVAEYDLSAVRVLLNGAEPIDPDLIPAFEKHFAPGGLARAAMTPCYGLAEATLAVTIAAPESTVIVDYVDREILNNDRQARTVDPSVGNARAVVNCGKPVPGVQVRIADEDGPLADRSVGDIEVRGLPVMRGYFRELTQSVRPGGWCPTGDLGYLADSCLYVTGRKKEMLIIGGQNHYPGDIEEAVKRAAGVYKERAIAVVLPADPAAGRLERIAVLAEVVVRLPPHSAIVSGIREAAAAELDGATVDVVLLRRGALLRTTSGKFQRLPMRRLLVAGTLEGVLVHVPFDERVSYGYGTEPCSR